MAAAEFDSHLKATLDEVLPAIREVVVKYMGGTDTKQIKTAGDAVCDLLVKAKLADYMVLKDEFIWAHPKNRFETGVDYVHCHNLIEKIMKQGFLQSELKQPRCFERSPGFVGLSEFDFNKKLFERSEGQLPEPENNTVRYLSFACTHTVFGLKCMRASCLTANTEISMDGRISKDRIFGECSSYKEPYENGMRWLVVRWEVNQALPELADFLQQCGNAGHGTEEHQSQLATLLQIHTAIVRFRDMKDLHGFMCSILGTGSNQVVKFCIVLQSALLRIRTELSRWRRRGSLSISVVC